MARVIEKDRWTCFTHSIIYSNCIHTAVGYHWYQYQRIELRLFGNWVNGDNGMRSNTMSIQFPLDTLSKKIEEWDSTAAPNTQAKQREEKQNKYQVFCILTAYTLSPYTHNGMAASISFTAVANQWQILLPFDIILQ